MLSVTSAMDNVIYERHDFNVHPRLRGRLDYLAEKHILYHLQTDRYGGLQCQRDQDGRPVCSPRCLRDVCLFTLASDSSRLNTIHDHLLPSNIFPLLLRESIARREMQTVEWIISKWPMKILSFSEVIPVEDFIDGTCLTRSLDGHSGMCIVDAIVLGLLKMKPESNLTFVDLSGFEKDRKLSRELCRLPILWMKKEDRTVEKIHEFMSESLTVTKDKVRHFLNRIEVIYSNLDSEFHHGNDIAPVTLHFDLHMDVDDVPLGLSLQRYTPFKFSCCRLWMRRISDAELRPRNIGLVFDPYRVTHFEYVDNHLSHNDRRIRDLLAALSAMKNLFALSLPESIDVTVNQTFPADLNACMKKMKFLHRLNLSFCNLKGMLGILLGDLKCRLVYLNLLDCRLVAADFLFLLGWRSIARLRELNLSSNSLVLLEQVFFAIIQKMPFLTCLSISHCSIMGDSIVRIIRVAEQCGRLKVVCFHPYTAMDLTSTLNILLACSPIRTLQKVLLFPEVYAFPGDDDMQRQANKDHALRLCYGFLSSLGRNDIDLEE